MVGKKRRFPTYVVKKEGNKYKAYDEQNKMNFHTAANSLEGLAKILKPYIEKRTGSWKFEEVKSPIQKLRDFDKSRVAAGKSPIFKDKKPPKFVRMKKQGMRTIMNVPTDEIDKYEKKGYKIIEGLDERNYAKEYANYQAKPEQIVRRSSRNKARSIMGDKTKIGMDVGHVDNDPMNNDLSNLRNEDPSENRREPRLRNELRIDPKTSSEKDIRHQIKYHEKMRDHYSGNARAKKSQNDDIKRLKGILKDRGFKEEIELDELSWYIKFHNWININTHKKGFEKLAKKYVELMKSDKKYRDSPNKAVHAIVQQYRNVSNRELTSYINNLVKKGVLPQELKADFDPTEAKISNFKKFIDQINNK